MALEIVGGAFLDAFITVLLERIAYPEVINFFKAKKLNDKLLKKIRIKLLSVHGVLEDAEGKQIRNASVRQWLDELKDVAFDADDLFDEILTEAKITANEVQSFYYLTTQNFCNGELEQTIGDILERLECLIEVKDTLRLQEGLVAKWPSRTPTTSLVEESCVYGRDDDKEVILKRLLSEGACDKKISVIPIVGMGGIGKTTLTQLAYNDKKVNDNFEIKGWVCVSEEFNVARVTKTILEAISSCAFATNDLNSLQVELKERLNGKKFLIVLDDIWNENYNEWCHLQSPFQYGAHGSKIIVTTRSRHVASIMQTVECHNLELLSDEDCWNLFAKHAFDYNDSAEQPPFEEIGRKIVKKCKGLPLAAKTLGGLLRSKNDVEEWDKILKSDIWDLSEKESDIIPALRLSYYLLPSYLKQCFAYCSIFPKGYEFKKSQLILLWMAENLVQQPKENKRIEEVGDEYFGELVSRFFIQQSRDDKSLFVMHDLINDLAKFVSGKFCTRLESENSSQEIERRTRYLSLDKSCCVNFKAFYRANHLRTLLLPGRLINQRNKLKLQQAFPKLSCLRVLSLSYFPKVEELPDSIGFLRHLRYLDVSKTVIKELPESICSLYNLQTLKASSCVYLTKLPEGLHNLINLRYLEFDGCVSLEAMPSQMGKLRTLQQLPFFIVGKNHGSSIGELGPLLHLRRSLTIGNLQHANAGDAAEAKLKDKEYLEHLCLYWRTYGFETDAHDPRHENDVLDNLRPHTKNLKVLEILNYMDTEFPNWLGDPSFRNLVSVRLNGCTHCCVLPPLGQLLSLKQLCIVDFRKVVSVGPEFYGNSSCDGPFPSLEILTFIRMGAWGKWCHVVGNESCRAFPILQQLHIRNCPLLTGNLPSNLPLLTKLVIEECPSLDCKANVNADQYYQSLESLEICQSYKTDTNDSRHEKDALDRLQPHTINLKELKISHYMGTEFPNWFVDPSLCNLVSVRLEGCRYCCVLPPLGQLPSLKELSITRFQGLVSVGTEFYWGGCSSVVNAMQQPFASLEILSFEGMWAWEKWSVIAAGDESYIAFPSLRQLQITDCPKLTGDFPSTLPFLTELIVIACPRLEFPLHASAADQCLQSLECLEIMYSCDSLRSFPMDHFPNLKHLSFRSCVNLESLTDSVLEGEGDRPPRHLKPVIIGCPNFRDSNLTSSR